MQQINNISEINRKKVSIRWNKQKYKYQLHLNKISKTRKYKNYKARILGFLAGDGNIDIRHEKNRVNAKHHDISFYPDHNSMISPFMESFIYLYLKEPTVKKRKNYFSVRVSSKPACIDLISTVSFGIHKWEVPFNFLDTKESRIEWVRAFFDCEASVSKYQIQVQSVNENGLEQVKNLLNELGIESRIYKYERKNKNWNTNYILCIKRKVIRQRFLNRIGFNHELKHRKLEKQFKSASVG